MFGIARLNTLAKASSAPAGRTAAVITTVGNAQVSTAQQKFGTGSFYSNNTTAALNTNTIDALSMSGDFCIEFYFRVTAFNVDNWFLTSRQNNGLATGDFQIRHNQSNLVFFINGMTQIDYSTSLVANTWYHVVMERVGTTINTYVNGTSAGTSTYSGTICATNKKITIGAANQSPVNGNEESFSGYMDEVRVSNIARYSGGYTAPSAAFVNDSNTVFLMHADGANASTVFTDDNT